MHGIPSKSCTEAEEQRKKSVGGVSWSMEAIRNRFGTEINISKELHVSDRYRASSSCVFGLCASFTPSEVAEHSSSQCRQSAETGASTTYQRCTLFFYPLLPLATQILIWFINQLQLLRPAATQDTSLPQPSQYHLHFQLNDQANHHIP